MKSSEFFHLVLSGDAASVLAALIKDPSLAQAGDRSGRSAIEVAVKNARFSGVLDCARALIDYSDMSWVADDQGLSDDAFKGAVRGNHPQLVALLLPYADATRLDDNGQSSLMVAASAGHLELVRVLLSASIPEQVNPQTGQTALMYAALAARSQRERDDRVQILRLLLPVSNVNHRCKKGHTALMHAAASANYPALQELLGYNPQSNARSEHGRDAIMLVTESFSASRNAPERAQCVRALMPFCDPKAIDPHSGENALIMAVRMSEVECIKVLVTFCDPLHQDKKGNTALMRALPLEDSIFDILLSVSDPLARRRLGPQTALSQVLDLVQSLFQFAPQNAAAQSIRQKSETQGVWHKITRLCLVEPDFKKVHKAQTVLTTLGIDIQQDMPQLFARLEHEAMKRVTNRASRAGAKKVQLVANPVLEPGKTGRGLVSPAGSPLTSPDAILTPAGVRPPEGGSNGVDGASGGRVRRAARL